MTLMLHGKHISNILQITTKIAKTTRILFKPRYFLPFQTIRTPLYYSLIYPYLNYGNVGKHLSLEIRINQKTTKEGNLSGLFHFQILEIIHVQFLKIYLFYKLLVFSVTPFKIDQNKNQNHSTDKVQNLANKRR